MKYIKNEKGGRIPKRGIQMSMKRFLAILLLIAMALFSLSACGKTQVDDNSKVVKIAVAAPMTGDNA